jgi:hypothetical protein
VKAKIKALLYQASSWGFPHFLSCLYHPFQYPPIPPKRIIYRSDKIIGIGILPVIIGIPTIIIAKLLISPAL